MAIDVQYEGDEAVVAGILFCNWSSDEIYRSITTIVMNVAPYQPGSFYKRELPCILNLLTQVDEDLDTIIIDGFVSLGKEKKDGLGMYLYHDMNNSVPIIGVAKTAFANTPDECKIYRGDSSKPLFVTSVGVSLSDAKECICAMHGNHRNPTLLKKTDQLCRNINT